MRSARALRMIRQRGKTAGEIPGPSMCQTICSSVGSHSSRGVSTSSSVTSSYGARAIRAHARSS